MRNIYNLETGTEQVPNAQKGKLADLVVICLSLLTVIVSVYCFVFVTDAGYRNLFLMPLTMAFAMMIMRKVIVATAGRIVFLIFYGITYLRFVLIPFLMVQSGFYHSRHYITPTDSAANTAVFLMCYELLAYTGMLCAFKKKLLLLQKPVKAFSTGNERSGLMWLSAVCVMVFVVAYCMLCGLSVRISILMFYLPATDAVFIFGESLLSAATALLYISGYKAWQKGNKNPSGNILFGIISIAWVCVCFGDVRLSYIVKAVTVIGLFESHLKKKVARKYMILIGLVCGVSVIAITLLDKSASHGIFFFTASENEKNTYVHVLQTYFAGPYNVAKSVELAKNFKGNGFDQFITDVLYNTYPWVKLLPENAVPTKALFNEVLYGYAVNGTQIIPLLGQGAVCFGLAFSVIPPLICLYLLIKMEIKAYKNRQDTFLSSYFVTEYAAAYLAFFQMYNLIIISGFLMNTVLIMMIIAYIQDHVKKGKLIIIFRR